jgi:hypothetical protein
VRHQIRETVAVYIFEVIRELCRVREVMRRCGPVGAERQGHRIHACYVEAFRAEDRHRGDSLAGRIDGVGVAVGFDVEVDRNCQCILGPEVDDA